MGVKRILDIRGWQPSDTLSFSLVQNLKKVCMIAFLSSVIKCLIGINLHNKNEISDKKDIAIYINKLNLVNMWQLHGM